MSRQVRKKSRNRYARSAKVSEYKTLQLVEAFAHDLTVRQAARRTRMSERTVRDRYADIRGKLLTACTTRPDFFNGFGHVLLDPDGSINIHVLEVLAIYADSAAFKHRMARRYPKYNPARDPALNHALEIVIRRFMAVDIPAPGEALLGALGRLMVAARTEAFLAQAGHGLPTRTARRLYLRSGFQRLAQQPDLRLRRFRTAGVEGFYRDLKAMLRRDPL